MYLGIWSDIEIVYCTEDLEGDVVTSSDKEDQENGEDVDGTELPFLTLEGGQKIQQTFRLSKGGGTMVMGAPLSKSRGNHRR